MIKNISTTIIVREPIGESRYNLSELLKSDPPISESQEPVSIGISDDVKKMQRNMEKLFLKQKEKGGIIDLEAEEKKYLVLTNTSQEQEENKFTELSPTDYQHDEAGLPCAKVVSPPRSPEKTSNNNVDPEEDYSYSYQNYNHHNKKGRGRGGKRGFHRNSQGSER